MALAVYLMFHTADSAKVLPNARKKCEVRWKGGFLDTTWQLTQRSLSRYNVDLPYTR